MVAENTNPEPPAPPEYLGVDDDRPVNRPTSPLVDPYVVSMAAVVDAYWPLSQRPPNWGRTEITETTIQIDPLAGPRFAEAVAVYMGY